MKFLSGFGILLSIHILFYIDTYIIASYPEGAQEHSFSFHPFRKAVSLLSTIRASVIRSLPMPVQHITDPCPVLASHFTLPKRPKNVRPVHSYIFCQPHKSNRLLELRRSFSITSAISGSNWLPLFDSISLMIDSFVSFFL